MLLTQLVNVTVLTPAVVIQLVLEAVGHAIVAFEIPVLSMKLSHVTCVSVASLDLALTTFVVEAYLLHSRR